MADDIQDANGQWLAADDLGDGRKIPRVKLAAGADGVAADISEANPLFVQIAGASGGSASDYELITSTYRVKTAFTGASIGDTLTATRIMEIVSDVAAQLGGTLWYNETTVAVLASAPLAANIEPVGAPGMTNAQFVAYAPMTDAKGEAIRALLAAATPAGENLIGQTGTPGDVIAFTPTLDTSAFASGDVIINPTAVTNAARINGGRVILQSLTLLDKDDQGAAMDLFLCSANTAFGTANAAPSITDANADSNVIHYIGQIAAADWIDLGGSRVATLKGIGVMAEAASGSRDLYVAAITRGTPTHTAAGIVGQASFVQL